MAQAELGIATISDKGGIAPVEWRIDDAPVPYPAALAAMDERVAAIRAGRAPELVWLLEHPPLYTAGTSARPGDLVAADRFPVYQAGRGGQFTYHGPGQRVAYVMLDLARRGGDVRRFVCDLENWMIAALARFGVKGERRAGRVGIWVDRAREKGPGREDKIAAIGVRVRHWVTLHGVSLNVDPDLGHFAGIVPCGIADPRLGVTSLADLGVYAQMAEVDDALRHAFAETFGARQR
ncbi:MAG: lipoyl(octanoyl) transferase LipB [Candidatus Odyssella sp.]|nr:lipoyl(octanoyl) transferase LipB [Candidatus Odyssella sp.]